MIKLDPWQEEALHHTGNILLVTGRQVGKTFILSMKAGDRMLSVPGTQILVSSLTEDQAKLIIVMTLTYLEKTNKKAIALGANKPTQNKITLKNGSFILARPVGQTGDALRGFTGHVWIPDEMSRMPRLVFTAGLPTLLTTGGEIWGASTPFGKYELVNGKREETFFYKAYCNRDNFWKVITASSEDVISNRPLTIDWTEPKKQASLALLKEQERMLSVKQYRQEYCGEFMEDLNQLFPDELINEICVLKRGNIKPDRKYFMGIDVGGMGDSETSYEIIDGTEDNLVQVENQTTLKTYINEVVDRTIALDNAWHCKGIGVDDGGLGFGVFSYLLKEGSTRNKVIALNNAKRVIDNDEREKRLLKEDMYYNLLALMEKRKIKLLDDENLKLSLKSVQLEVDGNAKKIFGTYTHIVEGIIRSAWMCTERKTLNLWCAWS